ncbi:hypothetical protein AKJ47_00605 [candidate division MSBL1 archaeon SCGC-AAA261G05]|uniref:Recombinase n=3 Tax=candidate division MSBL1 TaxID=215777 RepID=A0A133V162_9EURY|nr:hypothetical protein AKJ42_01590 [candidate division MSBL1 archaeon SCGC-AAA261C02]KXB04133.1 hypothetical protein AKJ47_00605 [candidate division MSBL1 archaeon SCGC-AAA261G05]KXB05029.1 hypothetical protein AKJ48_00485 [candidate division MSBL1 archaeon SCGC-AAA261O19]
MEGLIMESKSRVGTRQVSNSELIEDFLKDLELQGKSCGTIRDYKSYVSKFANFLESQDGEGSFLQVGAETLRDFLEFLKDDKGLSEKTLGNYFSGISSLYEYLKFEGLVKGNPVNPVRKRYIKISRGNSNDSERQLISIDEMSSLIRSILSARDKAIIVLFAKTGIRRNELSAIDLSDIDWEDKSIKLKEKFRQGKRSNLTVFFDDECEKVLGRWLDQRDEWLKDKETEALFLNSYGTRLKRSGIQRVVTKHAERMGLHDPDSDKLSERFTSHCFRHWFTTHLRRSGMPREYIKELRGDSRSEAMDIYHHIDREELRESYLAHVPKLGI